MNEIQNTNYAQMGQNIANLINKQVKKDAKFIDKISGGYDAAKNEYFNALAKGDQAAIAKAQDKYQSFTLAMRSAIEFLSNKFQIMMQIVGKLSLR